MIVMIHTNSTSEYMQSLKLLSMGVAVYLNWECPHGNVYKLRVLASHPERMAFSGVVVGTC